MAKAVGQFTITDLNDVNISTTAPADPVLNQLWLDSSAVPNVLRRWDGSAWLIVNDVSDKINAVAPFIKGTQIATTASWTGVAPFESLENGQQITYLLPQAPTGSATLNLTLKGGATTGAINCYYLGASRLTTHFGQGNVIRLTYLVNNRIGATDYTGWWADAAYADGNTIDRIQYNRAIKAKTAITAGYLVVADNTGSFFHLAKDVPFEIDKPILYASAAIALNATGTSNYTVYPNGISVRTNSGNGALTLTAYKALYIEGTLNGLVFTPIGTTLYTDTPTNNDSVYMLIGQLYDTYGFSLVGQHEMYRFTNGVFKSFAQIAAEADGKVDGLTGRVTTAEQKITPTAITQTVESQVTANGSVILATKGDITLTDEAWTAKFSQVGGVNLLKNTTITSGFYLSSTGGTLANALWGYSDYIEVVPGANYFVSGFTTLGTSPSTCFYTSTKSFISAVAGASRQTVVAPSNAKYFRFSLLITDLPMLILEKENGSKTTATTVNNEGMTVEDSVSPNKTTISPSGMMIRNKETSQQLLTVEPDSTYIPELTADDIISDSISRAVGDYNYLEINYYVAPTATGDGTGRDASNKADNIQTALRNATNYGLILKNVKIIINVDPGKYNGLFRVMGYMGNGEIAIMFGAGVYINGNIDIIDCSCRVRLNAGTTGNFVLTKGSYLNPMTVINCSHVLLERPVIIHPLATGYPIYVESSKLVVSSYDIAGSGGVSPVRAVYADYNSQVYMMFGKGNTQNGPFNAARGSVITAYSGIPMPAATANPDAETTTGTYFAKSTTRTNSTATPPTIAWQTVTKTFQAKLYRINNATNYRTDGSFVQGASPNNGESYKGYASWGKEIYDYLQDNGGYQSLTSIKLITERGGYGYGNVSMKVASPAARTGTAQGRYSTAETELAGFALGSNVETSQDLVLSTTTTATDDYANFTKILLKITVQKKV